MPANLKTYDAAQVAMLFGAIIITGGLADGTFVRVEQNSDAFMLKVGADGSGVRAKSNDKSAKITFTLLQSSDANLLLSAQHNLDIASPNGAGIAPLMVKDLSGQSLHAAAHAWISKMANSDFAREASTREWTIETDNIDSLVGGNNAAS